VQSSPSLAELQRWMRWALTHPLGTHRATAGEHLADLPARFVEPDGRALSSIAGEPVSGRGEVDRLSVHATGYFSRLHEALQLEYPRLLEALGDDEFRMLVAAHLLRAPSHSASLADLGEDLPATLRDHPSGKESPWLVDLAALERAVAEVWLSGPVGQPGWVVDGGEEPGAIRLELSELARLARVDWDVTSWRRSDAPPSPRPGHLVVWRREASTDVEWLDERAGAVLEALSRGADLGELCDRAGSLGMSAEEVGAAFGHWVERGWIVRAPGQ
jgi:uncharacterized protein